MLFHSASVLVTFLTPFEPFLFSPLVREMESQSVDSKVLRILPGQCLMKESNVYSR